MPYYQYEIILEEINIIQKQQEEQQKQQEKEHSMMQQKYNPSSMMRNVNNSMSQSMPKVSIPKF
jgi:sortase (surface protein transpeptidase)